MNKYERLKNELTESGTGKMKCFGNSMLPRLPNPSLNTYVVAEDYFVGDIVFCKVKGRWIDSHLVTQKCQNKGWMISNNRNHQNGWTKKIFGKVVLSRDKNGSTKEFK